MASTVLSNAHAQGFLLLTLPNCSLSTPATPPQTGILAVQCVTLDAPSELTMPDRDVWLVLKLNAFEMVVSPTQTINYDRSTYTYMFLPEEDNRSGPVQIVIPPDPYNQASYQDLETMEVILSQYGIVHDMQVISGEKGVVPTVSTAVPGVTSGNSTSDLKGRLVLMDEADGEVVATLDEEIPIKEDKSLANEGHEKDPVVIDLPGDEEERAGQREAYAHPAGPEEQDMLMKTAGLISRGIVFATSALTTGMTSASNYYIAYSTPSSKPVEFSPRARANIKRIHQVSGKAVEVTNKTTSIILNTLDHVASKLGGSSPRATRVSAPTPMYASQSQLGPPPLPPRPGSPGTSRLAPSPARTPPPLPPRKPRLHNRLLASTDLLITTLERSATQLIESGTEAISTSLGHRYGQDMADASKMAGGSARNVGLVYIDLRGVGRRALLKRAGKAVIKARMGKHEVVLGPEAQGIQSPPDLPPRWPGAPLSPPAYPGDAKGSADMAGGRKQY